jgi:regulator of protease activity HflC (stomatin/prohibitin superfamily)
MKMGERMGRGWSRCTPGERLDVLRELTLQLLDSSTVRAILDDCERVQFEVHESLRKHIRDFTCYRKYGVSTAERDAIMLAARAEAEAEAEAAEAEAKAAADAKKAAKTETDASPGAEGAEIKEDTDMGYRGGRFTAGGTQEGGQVLRRAHGRHRRGERVRV